MLQGGSSSPLAESIRALREYPSSTDRPNRPSPLSSTTSQSALDYRAPQSPRSPPPHSTTFDEPRSPREKLDALLAEEDSRVQDVVTSTAPSSSTSSSRTPKPTPADRGASATSNKLNSYAQLRNVSAPVVTSAGPPSPPSSPTMLPATRQNQVEPRPTAQRNPSIDSAVSSISSSAGTSFRSNAGHSYRPSSEMGSANPPDMNALVAAAGSPEAALLNMWKEKQSASAHNTQLWRLVEKQRTMILGLNKDLERALKDKERYRKKFKDLAQAPPLPNVATQRIDAITERGESRSPAYSEGQDSNRSNSVVDTQESPREAPASAQSSTAKAGRDIIMTPSPVLSQDPSSAPGSAKESARAEPPSLASNAQATLPPLDTSQRAHDSPEATKGQSLQPFDDQISPKSSAPAQAPSIDTFSNAPSFSITHATPVIGSGEFASPPKSSNPLRKAPPAPLNLSQAPRTSSHLHQAVSGGQSDDEYDDILEVDEIPNVERGRRKTREEDDYIRDVQAQQEFEERSRSKKKSKSKSKSKPSSEVTSDSDTFSPAQASSATMVSPPLGLPASPRMPPATNSLNAMLSPANSDASTQRSVISPPLLSPGLPMSPRHPPMNSPQPRILKQTIASPPMSPRDGAPLLSPRAPKQPIPLPPSTPLSFASPHLARAEAYAQQVNQQPPQQAPSQPPPGPPPPQPSIQTAPQPDLLKPTTLTVPETLHKGNGLISEPNSPQQIHRGLMSEQYPGLLLPPNALPSIQVKVFSSRLQPSRHSFMMPKPLEEDPVFILAIYARSDGNQLWRNEKTIHALPALDQQVRALCDFKGRLPDRSLFSGHAPAKIDARRAALNAYFDALLDTPMDEMAALVACEFLSTDVIGVETQQILAPPTEVRNGTKNNKPAAKVRPRKDGYLTKRGKNFGGWKARYFVLDGPEFRYYEAAGGAHLGTIRLVSAQIGKQSQQQTNQSPSRTEDTDNQYRHAFLILEPKRKDSSSLVRHVLCAESDEERDAWVEALLQYVDYHNDESTNSPTENTNQSAVIRKESASRHKEDRKDREREREQKPRKDSEKNEKGASLRGMSYEQTVAAEAPVRGPPLQSQGHTSPKASSFGGNGDWPQVYVEKNHPVISGPTNGSIIQDASTWGKKTLAPTSVKDKKRSIFAGFSRGRSSSDLGPVQSASPAPSQGGDRIPPDNQVFGIPLHAAVEYTQPFGVDNYLPAVVYRCLEYLQVKGAEKEEGIFRLSGSNIVIKGLRERFNNEGDVKLLDGQYYDVHAVASLLKLYLRELPSSILTRELHLEFLKVLDLDRREDKILAFNGLVHRLPRANFELLQALSSFLIDIINNANINKMTVRNVGIVFAPTLNIPAPLISMFLTDYADIFGAAAEDNNQSPPREIVVPPSADQGEMRSPRQQMFSDLSTPSYGQQAFPISNGQRQQSMMPPQSGYEPGYMQMRPGYELPAGSYQESGYGSLNRAMQGNGRDVKAKRRESGMLLMNMGMGNGPRNPNLQHLREQGNSNRMREDDLYG